MSILRVRCFIFAAIVVLDMLNICCKRYRNATIVGQVIHIFASLAENMDFSVFKASESDLSEPS